MDIYLVYSKGDDYGACITELVETTQEFAEQYYGKQRVDADDVETLKKYLNLVEFEEEKERSAEGRFYGND